MAGKDKGVPQFIIVIAEDRSRRKDNWEEIDDWCFTEKEAIARVKYHLEDGVSSECIRVFRVGAQVKFDWESKVKVTLKL
jgi:hypothetical protein